MEVFIFISVTIFIISILFELIKYNLFFFYKLIVLILLIYSWAYF